MVFTNIAPKLGDFPWLYHITLPKTNLAHENSLSQNGKACIPTIHFQVQAGSGAGSLPEGFTGYFPPTKNLIRSLGTGGSRWVPYDDDHVDRLANVPGFKLES